MRLILTGLLFSFSRGPWLAFAAAMALFAVLKGGRVAAAIAVAAALVFAGALWLNEPLRERAASAFKAGENMDRLLLWRGTMDMIQDNPATGIGPGTYKKRITPYIEGFHHEFSATGHAHNSYLHLFAESGIVTFALYLGVVFIGLKTALFAWRRSQTEEEAGLSLGIACSLAGFAIAGLFQSNFTDAVSAFNFWFLLGLATVMARKYRGVA
jgi:O-antigen ligase